MSQEWKDFLFCLFLGFFGVHKFREGRVAMGLAYLFTMGIFGIGWIYDSIRLFIRAVIPTIARLTARRLPTDAPLPVVGANLVLRGSERCRYSGRVVRADANEGFEGMLSITDERIVFTAPRHSFDRAITDLSSVTPYSDAILLQFGSEQDSFITYDGPYICDILVRIINE